MILERGIQLVLLATALLWHARTDARAASSAVKFCGRQLGEIMSRLCHAYNSPSWDVPTVVEQHGAGVRRKRELGIADECCTIGCTLEELSKYCSISAYSETHMIENRSAEESGRTVPAVIARPAPKDGEGRITDTAVAPGAGDLHPEVIRNAARAAPLVGTVSPLLTWGKTLNTEMSPTAQDLSSYK